MSVVSQFLQTPCDSHCDAVVRILRYVKGTPGQGMRIEVIPRLLAIVMQIGQANPQIDVLHQGIVCSLKVT